MANILTIADDKVKCTSTNTLVQNWIKTRMIKVMKLTVDNAFRARQASLRSSRRVDVWTLSTSFSI